MVECATWNTDDINHRRRIVDSSIDDIKDATAIQHAIHNVQHGLHNLDTRNKLGISLLIKILICSVSP